MTDGPPAGKDSADFLGLACGDAVRPEFPAAEGGKIGSDLFREIE
jgi:hypothetical protein